MFSIVARLPRLARDVFVIFTERTPSMGDPPAEFGHTEKMSRFLHRDQPISRRTRLAASAVVVLGALTVAGCSDMPEVSISTEQLKQLASDAKSQVQTIAKDASTIGAQLSTLPATARDTAQQAVDAAKSASQQAQSALESAEQSRDDAQQKIADAKTALADASAKLEDLTASAGDTVTPEVQSAIDALSAQIDALKTSVDEAAS